MDVVFALILVAALLALVGYLVRPLSDKPAGSRRDPSCTCMVLRPATEWSEAVVVPDANCPVHKAGEA